MPGCSARTPGSRSRRSGRAWCRERSLGAGSPRRTTARGTRRRGGSARPLCLRAGRDLARRLRASRHGNPRGVDRRRGERLRGLRLRPGVRAGRRGADGCRARRAVEGRALPSCQGCPGPSCPEPLEERGLGRGAVSHQAPVDFGAEHGHVRHHVQPDEEDHRARRRLAEQSSFARDGGRPGAPGTSPRAPTVARSAPGSTSRIPCSTLVRR